MNSEKSKDINLLLIYENKISTVELLHRIFIEYEKKTNLSIKMKKAVSVTLTDIINVDVIFLIRPNYYVAYQIGKIGSNIGKTIITYCDDDLLNIKRSFHDLRWRKQSLVRLLNMSDVFYSPNKRIIEKFQVFIKKGKTFVFDTPVDEKDVVIREFEPEYFENNSVKILYAASLAHKVFFDKYISPILGRIVQKYEKNVSFTFIGVEPQIDPEIVKKGNFNFYSSMPLAEYRRFVNSGKYDIGLAPLEISEFTKCKYFNKYLEYSMAGIMGIYTKTEPYTNVIADGINGILVENTADKWLKALCRVIDDASLRAKIISNAQNYITQKFDPDTLCKKFEHEIKESILNKPSRTIKSVRKYKMFLLFARGIYLLERTYEMIYKAVQAYRQEGSKGVYRKIKIHFNINSRKGKL